MADAGSWTVDVLPVDFGLHDVWVDADGSAIVAGSFVMMCRTGFGPWERATVRGKPQHMAVAGVGALRIAVGYPHSCVISPDRGRRWQNKAVGAKRKLDAIACVTEQRIFLAGEDGAYLTEDAGKTFRNVGPMRHVAVAEQGVFAVSDDWKPILHRWDGGWRPVGPMPDRSNQLVAAGDVLLSVYTNVHRSTDGGATWDEVVPAREGVYLTAIDANLTGRVVVVGYGGLVAVSEDFGASWQEHRPTDRHLRGVCVAPDEEIWAVGDDGVLVRSGQDPAREVAVPAVELAPDDGVAIDAVLRAAAPVPAWSAPEPLGASVHEAPVVAAAFLDDTHAVTGDLEGRLAWHERRADGHWVSEVTELGAAITGLAALGEAMFAIVGGALVQLDRGARRPIATRGKLTHLAARANRLAAAGAKRVVAWPVAEGVLGKPVEVDAGGEVVDLDVSADGKQLVFVVGDRVYAHDAATGKPTGSFRRKGARARFVPSGKHLYLATDSYELGVVSVTKGGGRDKLYTGNRHWRVATSPRVTTLAALSHGDELDVIDTASEATLMAWRSSDEVTACGAPRPAAVRPAPLARLAIPAHATFTAVALSDGSGVITGDASGEVAIFDARRLELHRAQPPRSVRVQPALESPLLDGRVLACGGTDDDRVLVLGDDHRLRVIDPDTGEVRAGPRLDIANAVRLHALGDVVVVMTPEGWSGVDRRTGARRWAASFPVRDATAYGGALYGFEHRSSYASGEVPHHRLYRLEPATGAVTEVALAPPPGMRDALGFSSRATAIARGLVGAFVDADRTVRSVLIEPVEGAVTEPPVNLELQVPAVDPTGRYVMCTLDDGVQIRDTRDPAWPVIARPNVRLGDALPLVEAGVIVGVHTYAHCVEVHDLAGTLVARMRGLGAARSVELFATARGEAIVTCSQLDLVRRWPVPRR